MLRQLFQPAPEVLAKLVEDVRPRDVAADIGHTGQSHPVQAGFPGDLVHGDDAAEAEGSVCDQFFKSVPDHGGLSKADDA